MNRRLTSALTIVVKTPGLTAYDYCNQFKQYGVIESYAKGFSYRDLEATKRLLRSKDPKTGERLIYATKEEREYEYTWRPMSMLTTFGARQLHNHMRAISIGAKRASLRLGKVLKQLTE